MAGSISITDYGAVGNGTTDNHDAIQAALDAAAANGDTVTIPAGTFAYSGTLTDNGIAVTGVGDDSILKALDPANEALTVTGNGGAVSDLQLDGTGTTRLTTFQASMIWVDAAQNFTIQNVLINGSSAVGIYDDGGQTGLIQNNTVENTLEDSITNIDGASGIVIKGNRILNSGDDGISNNGYVGMPVPQNITIEDNTILNNLSGRGLEVSGGSNITISGNYVDNPDGYADVYISSESGWGTQGDSNITVSGNTLVDGGPNQGNILVWNSQGSAYAITGLTISGNQIVTPGAAPIQFAGNGAESGTIENNTAYASGDFFNAGNSLASFSETNNQVVSPSSYTTPLVAPGGGVGTTSAATGSGSSAAGTSSGSSSSAGDTGSSGAGVSTSTGSDTSASTGGVTMGEGGLTYTGSGTDTSSGSGDVLTPAPTTPVAATGTGDSSSITPVSTTSTPTTTPITTTTPTATGDSSLQSIEAEVQSLETMIESLIQGLVQAISGIVSGTGSASTSSSGTSTQASGLFGGGGTTHHHAH